MNTRAKTLIAIAIAVVIAAVTAIGLSAAPKAVLTTVPVSSTSSAQQTTPLPLPPFLNPANTVPVTDHTPPRHLWHSFKRKLIPWYWDRQSAFVQYNSSHRNLVVNWAGWFDPTTKKQGSERLRFPLSFYPTDADVLGGPGWNALVVGGKGNADNAIVETLYFRWPTGATSAILGGPVILPNHTGTLRSLEVDEDGKRGVRFVLGNLNANGGINALVQFEDSRDLYALNLLDGSHSLVASASTSAGAIGHIPELNDDHNLCWKADHMLYGHVYVFGFRGARDASGSSTLVFVDSDRDGATEIHMLVSPLDWDTHDLSDDSQYLW